MFTHEPTPIPPNPASIRICDTITIANHSNLHIQCPRVLLCCAQLVVLVFLSPSTRVRTAHRFYKIQYGAYALANTQ